MSGRRYLRRTLLACIAENDGDTMVDLARTVERGDARALIELALYHRVLPHLYLRLHRLAGVDPQLLATLQHGFALHAGRHMRVMADLAAFGEAMAPHGIRWMVVKGPVVAELLYGDPSLRTYDDLDILVSPADFERTIGVLEAAGFRLLDRNWDLIWREFRGQLHFSLRMGTVADVHWHLLNRETVRRSLSVRTEDVFKRIRTVKLGGLVVQTLDPVDTVVHLCTHAAIAGGDRLIWLKDIERALAIEAPAWEAVIARAEEWGAGPLIAVILDRAMRLLGAPIPEEAVRRLYRSRLRQSLTRAADVLWPVARSRGQITPAVLWTQAARPSWWGTLAALSWRVSRRPLRYLRGGTLRERSDDASSEAAPILLPSGGPGARDRFLRSVSRGSDAEAEGRT